MKWYRLATIFVVFLSLTVPNLAQHDDDDEQQDDPVEDQNVVRGQIESCSG